MGNKNPAEDRSPAFLMVVGGLLALVSTFLMWFEVETGGDGSGDRSYTGSDFMKGLGAGLIVFGIVLLIIGYLYALKLPKGRGLAIITIVIAVFLTLTGILGVAQPALALGNFGGDEVADDFGIAEDDDVAEALQEAEDEDTINIKPGVGVLLTLGGGVLALLGGSFTLIRRRTSPPPSPTDTAAA